MSRRLGMNFNAYSPFLPVKTNVGQYKQTCEQERERERQADRDGNTVVKGEGDKTNATATLQQLQQPLRPVVVGVDVGGCCFGRHFTQWHSHNQDKCPAAAAAEVAALATLAAGRQDASSSSSCMCIKLHYVLLFDAFCIESKDPSLSSMCR